MYESTQGPQQPLEPPVLNPTGGVKVKPPTDKLVFNKDPNNPASGVFVAQENHEIFKDLPEGIIVVSKEDREIISMLLYFVGASFSDAVPFFLALSLPSRFSYLGTALLRCRCTV